MRLHVNRGKHVHNIIDISQPLAFSSSSSTSRIVIHSDPHHAWISRICDWRRKRVVTGNWVNSGLKLKLHECRTCKKLLILFIVSSYLKSQHLCSFLYFNCGLVNNRGRVTAINNSKIDESNF